MLILRPFVRAARIAASFSMFSKSAPEKPTVRLATFCQSTVKTKGFPWAWILKISKRSLMSGMSKITRRSNRPGRTKAGSRLSGRLVAAKTMQLSLGVKPSISTKSWLRVCSCSLWPPIKPIPRAPPIASSSSIKIIARPVFFAWAKRSRIRALPTPTSISINSEPAMVKKGTFASPATAFANKVLPHPLGPISKTPFGVRAPNWLYFLGFFKKSTTSSNSLFDSSTPPTSLKETFCLPLENLLALLLPKEKSTSWALPAWRERK